MTDWYSMVESIHDAMQAVEKAHEASETLCEKSDRENIQNFQIRMQELSKRLEQMQEILSHEDTYTLDELADVFGQMLGDRKTYHRIPHYDLKNSN